MTKVNDLTDDTFSGALLAAPKVGVLFHAPWSGHSQLMKTTMESIAENEEDIVIYFAQAELNVSTVAKFGIRTVPTLVLFENGKLQGVRIGRQTKDDILRFLTEP